MKISIIVAVSRNGVIGKEGKIPWKLPGDLAYFKDLTTGHAIAMGRKTFESLRRPLPDRQNIVITKQKHYLAPGCTMADSLEDAIQKAKGEEVFIIGGGEVYREALPLAHKIYLTLVNHDFEGDTFFFPLDPNVWRLVDRKPGIIDEKNVHPHEFLIFEKVKR